MRKIILQLLDAAAEFDFNAGGAARQRDDINFFDAMRIAELALNARPFIERIDGHNHRQARGGRTGSGGHSRFPRQAFSSTPRACFTHCVSALSMDALISFAGGKFIFTGVQRRCLRHRNA